MIIECPLNHLFHDAHDVIITSRTDVRGMNDDNDVQTLVDVLNKIMLKLRFLLTFVIDVQTSLTFERQTRRRKPNDPELSTSIITPSLGVGTKNKKINKFLVRARFELQTSRSPILSLDHSTIGDSNRNLNVFVITISKSPHNFCT